MQEILKFKLLAFQLNRLYLTRKNSIGDGQNRFLSLIVMHQMNLNC